MSASPTMLRWGVLGTGGIAAKFAQSIAVLSHQTLIAAASHTPGKAERYAQTHGVDQWFESYEKLVSHADVDAVYVANTHNFHAETVALALNARKHVLCEKPMAVNAGQVRGLIDLAKQQNCFLMEGMWTRFLPALVQAKEWVDEGKIGEVLQIEASFGFRNEWRRDSRMVNPALAGGTLLDMGIYPLALALLFTEAKKPAAIRGAATRGGTGVDTDDVILLEYDRGVKALLRCSHHLNLPNDAHIQGSRGEIYLPATFIGTDRVELRLESETISKSFPMNHNEGFRFEIEHAFECIRSDLIESPLMPLSETLVLAETMDSLRKEWGVRYPFE